jgi:uncharacterized membrane protein YiaA
MHDSDPITATYLGQFAYLTGSLSACLNDMLRGLYFTLLLLFSYTNIQKLRYIYSR